MNGSLALAKELTSAIEQNDLSSDALQVVICPPYVYLSQLQSLTEKTRISIGAQNSHTHVSGAYTGEVSAKMLQELGIEYCIVGHSERREYFQESSEELRAKLRNTLDHQITPIFCFGESLEQREAGKHEETVILQLEEGLAELSLEEITTCVLAYEPIWAIGTGKVATPEQANQMHLSIRRFLNTRGGNENSQKISILYGGSVNGKNAHELLSQPEINGALVGGASLQAENFNQIIQSAQSLL